MRNNDINNKIIEIRNLSKLYNQKGNHVTILDNINLDICEGRILGIIGRSGSGKSTLLRIIAGLIEPSSGEIIYHNKPPKNETSLKGGSASLSTGKPRISMVFQNSGLIPWLNSFDNIALGLAERNLPKNIIREKTLNAINLVGLKGYADAYPKEISGGMRQRVGLARALVMEPDILLMDEPFSALDYLTANTVKNDLLDLWFERSVFSIKSIIIVTHSIEEAVSLCDKVVVLSSNPGTIITEVPIEIPHPRDVNLQKFHDKVDSLYVAITDSGKNGASEDAERNLRRRYPQGVSVINLFYFLLMVKNKAVDNKTDTKMLAQELKLSNEQLVILVETLSLLNFIEIKENDIILSSAGRILLEADEAGQKRIFREHIVKCVPFIAEIYRRLQDSQNTPIPKSELNAMLEKQFSYEQATGILTSTVSWARYADLFSYDNVKQELCLDHDVHQV